jgi:hypothetical protein
MSDDDLGAKPEPDTQPPELFPGGADAVDDSRKYRESNPATRDLNPAENPAVEDALPDEIAEGDEKQQEPDDATGENDDQPTEPPA